MDNYKKSSIINSYMYNFINRFLIASLLTVFCLIFFKKDSSFKKKFYDKFLSENFNFVYINNIYNKYFGGSIPFSNLFHDTTAVFNEKLSYSGYESYLDGVSLAVTDDYYVPAIAPGLVIFIGEKDGYGNTVILQQSNGIDVWYGNLKDINVKMYSYISLGEFIGNCSNNLYLVFKKDGNVLDFKKFI